MLIYTEPKVTCLAEQVFYGADHINWRSDAPSAGEALAEFSGRLCYLSFGEDAGIEGHRTVRGRTTNKEYLDNILNVRHGSVIEHAVWSYLFEGISRSLTHELVRHRHLSYSQLSQRYVDESEVGFVLPPEIKVGTMAYYIWKESCEQDLAEYRRLLSIVQSEIQDEESPTMRKKRARQTARSVLPNCTETKIVVTGNARAWRHFIEMRASKAADVEIRRLAIAVLKDLQQRAPNLFGDYTIVTASDGTEVASTNFERV